MPTLDECIDFLRKVRNRTDTISSEEIDKKLSSEKEKAKQYKQEGNANYIWCLQKTLCIQNNYIRAFSLLKDREYYEAWCIFERAEISLYSLEQHFEYGWKNFHLDFIYDHIKKWQDIYPYKFFMSPEIVEEEKICTICRKPFSIRNPCDHRVGQLYMGEMCYYEVTKAELVGMAIVSDPVQKYSVPFIVEPSKEIRDTYNYSVIAYLIRRLSSPFDKWDYEWQKRRIPHSHFRDIGRNKPCPCGSDKKYKQCCLSKSGVLSPHIEFIFDVLPSSELMTTEYSF